MRSYQDIIDECVRVRTARGAIYGGVEMNFQDTADIFNASSKRTPPITAREVALILYAVKTARLKTDPEHADSHIDRINYAIFEAMLSLPPVAPEPTVAAEISKAQEILAAVRTGPSPSEVSAAIQTVLAPGPDRDLAIATNPILKAARPAGIPEYTVPETRPIPPEIPPPFPNDPLPGFLAKKV